MVLRKAANSSKTLRTLNSNKLYVEALIKIVSYAVVRGKPTEAQLYLDQFLDEVREQDRTRGRPVRDREALSLADVVYYGLKKTPKGVCMINCTTGQSFSNEEILKRAIPIARAFNAKGARGKTIMLVMRNTEFIVSVYYGALFSGVKLFLLDPLSNIFELNHFLALVQPEYVFCDTDRVGDVRRAAAAASPAPRDVIPSDEIAAFTEGQSNVIEGFEVPVLDPESVAALLPTSGSTGPAKAAKITHKALIIHMPTLWAYDTSFPVPTSRAMFLSTAQWMTFTDMLVTGPVYQITLLISPQKTPEHACHIFETYRPTWALLVPGTAAVISRIVEPHQLTSLRQVVITGAPPGPSSMTTLKEKLPTTAILSNSYGMTEASGFTAVADREAPFLSIGKVFNIFHYKLVDDDNKEVSDVKTNGELFLKSEAMTKGYLNNEAGYKECLSEDGWWKTGDVFYRDENDYLFFVERKKFWFKHLNYHISPEELEHIIGGIPGVQGCVAVGTERGAAAAVVPADGAAVTREQIHAAVSAQLIEYKHLHGGIAFVDSLPRTHSGKLHRADCTKLVNQLVEKGECFV